MQYWLFKTEPNSFSIDDLAAAPGKKTGWDGVRNYQARNMLRDEIAIGDQVLVYHSNSEPSSIVGLAKVIRNGYPDPTAFDSKNDHFDPKSDPSAPRWYQVDIRFLAKFPEPLALAVLKADKKLDGMTLLQKGSRLSVQPVSAGHFAHILKLAKFTEGLR